MHTLTPRHTACWSPYSTSPGHPNRGKGTMPEFYVSLLDWPLHHCFSPLSFSFLLSCLVFFLVLFIILWTHLNFRATFLAHCTCTPHVTTSPSVCPVCIYTSLPVSDNPSLMKAFTGCRNVGSSWDLASVSAKFFKIIPTSHHQLSFITPCHPIIIFEAGGLCTINWQ